MSDAVSGVGTEFRRGDGASSEAFTKLAEVLSIGGPSMTRKFIDVTNLDSTGGYEEVIAGFRDGGTVTLAMNFTLANYNTLKDDYESDDSVNYQLYLSDSGHTTLDFAGFVVEMPLNVAKEEAIKINVTVKITGSVTLTT